MRVLPAVGNMTAVNIGNLTEYCVDKPNLQPGSAPALAPDDAPDPQGAPPAPPTPEASDTGEHSTLALHATIWSLKVCVHTGRLRA